MNEDDILDVEQPNEPSTGNSEIDNTDTENGNTQIVLDNDALEEILTSPSEPYPVMIVEEEEPEYEIEPFALTGTYNGTISDTYLDYFEGIVEKLPYDTHYVIWRSGEYAYSLAYGEEIEFAEDTFSGDCTVVDVFRDGTNYNSIWKVKYSEDTIDLQASDLFVYSDFDRFPTVERGFSSLEAEVILFALGFAVVFSICNSIFKCIFDRFRR